MRPTAVRYVIIAVCVLMSIVLYLDRFCVSFSQTYIREDLGLRQWQMDIFIGAFFLSYALGQVPAGWLSDRYGPRLTLAAYILSWSIFTAWIGAAYGFAVLMIMRLGCGLGQAGAYPACGTLLSRWVPLSSRGTASSLVVLGGRIGAAISPVLTSMLILACIPQNISPLMAEKDLLEASPEEVLKGETIRGQLVPTSISDKTSKEGSARKPPKPHVVVLAALIPPDLRKRLEASDDPEVVVEAINTLIRDPRVQQAVVPTDKSNVFAKLNLEGEVVKRLVERDKGVELTEAQTQRVNRLILEASLPKLRKFYGAGWRPVMYIYGAAGVLVALVFWFFFRDQPWQHPHCNLAEQELISAGKPDFQPQRKSGIPLVRLMSSGNMWLSSFSQATTNIAWAFTVLSLPRYLVEVHNVPIFERGLMTMVPAFGGIAGMLMGGWLTDVMTRWLGLRWGRALPMGLTRFGAAAAYFSCIFLTDPWHVTMALTAVFLCTDLGVPAVWSFCQDVGGRHVGSVLGWGNMFGNFAAALAPLSYNLCQDLMIAAQAPVAGTTLSSFGHALFPNAQSYSGFAAIAAPWNVTFGMCGLMFILSGLAGLAINSTRKLFPEDEAPAA